MVLKIDYDTVKLQKVIWRHFYDVMKYVTEKRHQIDVKKFPFSSPYLSKTLVALLTTPWV